MPGIVLWALYTPFHVREKFFYVSLFIIFLEVRKARLREDKPGFQGCTGIIDL